MTSRRALLASIGTLILMALAAYLLLTRPDPLEAAELAALPGAPDPRAGALVFRAAGCASCHKAPEAEDSEAPVLSGGMRFDTPFGTFVAPNISPHPDAGIGDWSDDELMTAMIRGISPDGAHYFPAFPYTSYARADPKDLADLIAYLRTLPADATPSQPHEVGFPFNIRRNLGLWKLLFLEEEWVVEGPLDSQQTRGRYLVEALGHCGECHTGRNSLGGMDADRWLAGAPNPSGKGTIPNITPGKLDWSASDIAEYLKSGFTPDYDTAGGHMADVIENTAYLSDEDRLAIASYLKAVPARE